MQITGKLAVDQSNKSVFADLLWSKNTWTAMNSNYNYRLYLNATTDYNVNRFYFNIVYTYSKIGLYNLSIDCVNSNVSYQQMININDCKINIYKFRNRKLSYKIFLSQ